MNKNIYRLIILKTYLLCKKEEDIEVKYGLIKTCLSHLIDDYELTNNAIHINNINRRKIMIELRMLFSEKVLDNDTYIMCLDLVTELFEYYEDLNYKNRTY